MEIILEWLASELARGQDQVQPMPWSLKRIHRLVVTSATYQQSSSTIADPSSTSPGLLSWQRDPENQWLSRMNRQRLDVEPWRDAMLAVAGNLDMTLGGPAIELDLPTNVRRTLYGKVGRDEQNDMLRLFDFPPPTSHSPARDATTTPLQQLFVLNSSFIEAQASLFSKRLQTEWPQESLSEQLNRCYQQLFQRNPTEQELRLGQQFLTDGAGTINLSRWPLYVQSLFGLNELLFVD